MGCSPPRKVNDQDFVCVCWPSSRRDIGNTSTCPFGSTLALHLIELGSNNRDARSAIGIRGEIAAGDSAPVGSGERKNRNDDVENESSTLRFLAQTILLLFFVCDDGVGKRASGLVFSQHKYLRSRFNLSQVNC